MTETIADRLEAVRARVRRACERANRDPAAVTIVAVSKGQPAAAIREAVSAGQRVFGENRVQEAAGKIAALSEDERIPAWHLVGHLQRNKARTAAALFDCIHSIDALQLAQALSARAARPLDVLIQVNVAAEASKQGVAPADVASLADGISRLPGLRLTGLMTIAPRVDDPELVRPVFRDLKALAAAYGMAQVSMGMTEDFEVAIEEGATLVRIGRAIFGARADPA